MSDPRAALLAFWQAMNDWERACWRRHQGEDGSVAERQALARREQEAIFERWVHPRERARPTARRGSFGDPPEYEGETIVEVSAGEPLFITTRQASEQTVRYELERDGGEWKVAGKEVQRSNGIWRRGVV